MSAAQSLLGCGIMEESIRPRMVLLTSYFENIGSHFSSVQPQTPFSRRMLYFSTPGQKCLGALFFLNLVMSSWILEVPFQDVTGGVRMSIQAGELRQGMSVGRMWSQGNEKVSKTCRETQSK